MEAKSTKWWPKVRKTVNPAGATFLSEGEKFWVKKLHSPLSFKLFRAGGARPGELTLCIFFGTFCKENMCSLWVGARLLEPPRIS